MKHDAFTRLLNLLLGASWAFVLVGALLVFKTFIFLGFTAAFLFTFIYLFVALFIVLTLDAFATNKERLYEEQKQTELLEKIFEKLQNESN